MMILNLEKSTDQGGQPTHHLITISWDFELNVDAVVPRFGLNHLHLSNIPGVAGQPTCHALQQSLMKDLTWNGAGQRSLPLGREEERPWEGGERVILEVDSEEDPQHKVRVREALTLEECTAGEYTTPSVKHRKEKEDLPLWVTSITWVSPGHESPDAP
ncbi:hypothetical protein DUI87_06670 [Hirundo rustica rustica]|uniref:Uncharacterized protein n=1 Tax=Hirundo rustica rustica TaxID=333673 RepID=A0A3M0KT50_HIRRU|nr:hypothetical protein DUI87_06670 [Hirundo rustica rustica]